MYTPLDTNIFQEDCCVDDLLSGATTIEDLLKSQQTAERTFRNKRILSQKTMHYSSKHSVTYPRWYKRRSLEFDQSSSILTPALLWYPKEVEFGFKVPELKNISKVTKHTVLLETSQLFDPLGLGGPVPSSGKIFVQQLWQEKLDRDEKLQEPFRSW